MKKIVDLELIVPIDSQKIFFGSYNGFQRYDIYKNKITKNIERSMRQAFWTPEEISLIHDKENFENLPNHVQEIIINNLLFQTLMDSAQNRGLDSIMSEIVTSSEWESVFKSQAYFELIHSLSYSHIIREMFSSDATDVFNRIYELDAIKNRVSAEIEAYGKVKDLLKKDLLTDTEENRKTILSLLIQIYFLEGIKFYVSFLVTYIINDSYRNAIPGISKIIKLINYDEDKHVAVIGSLLNILKKDEDEGFKDLFKKKWFEEETIKIVKKVVDEEIIWAKYLLDFGPVKSLTLNIIEEFIKYYANLRLKNIGIEPIYKINNDIEIVKWFEFYKDINKDNTAQQEQTSISYNIGTMEFDIGEKDLESLLEEIIKEK